MTFEILRRYANLPVTDIQDINSVIDDVSNGIALERNAHTGFSEFSWSLQETEVCVIV